MFLVIDLYYQYSDPAQHIILTKIQDIYDLYDLYDLHDLYDLGHDLSEVAGDNGAIN